MDCAKEYVTLDSSKWSWVVFSDAKRFTIEISHEIRSYWNEFRKDTELFSGRQYGGAGLTVLRAFTGDLILDLKVFTRLKTSNNYDKGMKEALLPKKDDCIPTTWIFQQENAVDSSDTTATECYQLLSLFSTMYLSILCI